MVRGRLVATYASQGLGLGWVTCHLCLLGPSYETALILVLLAELVRTPRGVERWALCSPRGVLNAWG